MGIGSFVGTILGTVPFVVMALWSCKINLKREYRGHQFLLPVLSVIYCLIAMLLLNQITQNLVRAIQMLAGVLQGVPGIGYLLGRLYGILRLGYGVQLLCNTVVMAVFCILKRLLLPVIRKNWTKWKSLYVVTTGQFYTELGGRSVLQKRFIHMREFFRFVYVTLIALGALDCVLALRFANSAAFRFPFYPVFGIIVIGEISFFLNGLTFGEGVFAETEEEPDIVDVDYTELRKKLKETFGNRICQDDDIPGDHACKETVDWKERIGHADELDQIAGAYFQTLQQETVIQADYVSATRKLLHQKSVLICHPFYQDLTDYILLPVFHKLLNQNKCLVVCGRLTDEEDIVRWLTEGISDVTNLPKLWKIEQLSSATRSADTDIGILGFQKLYDLDTLSASREFLEKVSFIILLEPSNLLGTGQIGLRSILQMCEQKNKKLTYCILDRNVDGLVDALSHVIRQSITEVIAAPAPTSPYSRIFWKAEGPGMQARILPHISHYMGIGTEIACLAMHEGVDNIHWYSGDGMALKDLKWNTEQYYQPICQYIHSPKTQSELSERFRFHQNLWQARLEKEAFLIVEDEFHNLFEMSRTFAARIQKKGFINILSENYMLRDYMSDNARLFSSDLKAIPSFVPDYARTQRNFVLRMLMLMAVAPVDESTLNRELALHGCESKNAYQKLCELIETQLGISDFHIQTIREYVGIGGNRYSRFSYQVDRSVVEEVFDAALKSAYYVVENEKMQTYPMGNRLMGHIEQVLLPGQYFCYDGKYYQVRTISAQNGIIVRRAAEHLNGRLCYRQLRDYTLHVLEEKEDIQNVRGLIIQMIRADVAVDTDGYLEMKSANLLEESSLVTLHPVRKRQITHKEVLKVSIPDASEEVRFTICVLFNELFQTVYPNESGYIVAVPGQLPELVRDHAKYRTDIRAVVPGVTGEGLQSDSIYFIEDSCIDIGLLVSAERNLQRFLEIVCDYLDWYLEKGAKEAEEEKSERHREDRQFERMAEQTAAEDVEGEDEELIDTETYGKDDWKGSGDFLQYGYGKIPEWLALAQTAEFLKEHRFADSNLHRSRKWMPEFDGESSYDPGQPGVHYCDFCGAILEKGHYDVLKDGRERCPECSREAIKTQKQFKQVYVETLDEMQRIFGISMDYKVKVRMANARKVNDLPGVSYTPTPQSDARVLGYAENHHGEYKLLVENGAPKWTMKSTLVHELCHIWQYANWKTEDVAAVCQNENQRLRMYEGMAVWTEIQYLNSMGEKERAIRYKRNRDVDQSVYGEGMKLFIRKYPIRDVSDVSEKKTPFKKFPPIG